MTNTEKQIEEIIKKVRTVEFLHGVPVSLPSETVELLRSGIRGAITQALAEDRERVRGDMEKLRKPLLKNDPKYFIDGKEMRLMGESDSSKYWKDYASERYNQALDDLIDYLDKPL